MKVGMRYSRVNSMLASIAAFRRRAYSRVNSWPPEPMRNTPPGTNEAPDRRGFAVYGIAKTGTNRRCAVMVLPK